MITYPKIETLYDRGENHKVITDHLRFRDFDLIKHWFVTEKIDGMNIRVIYDAGELSFNGRTDNAQLSNQLLVYLQAIFKIDAFREIFPQDDKTSTVVLFGEGYGPKIQSGGVYRDIPGFRLFDVWVDGWWLEWPNIADIAQQFKVKTVPVIKQKLDILPASWDALSALFVRGSEVAIDDSNKYGIIPEGIVARTFPQLYTRYGGRVMWKLKVKDF